MYGLIGWWSALVASTVSAGPVAAAALDAQTASTVSSTASPGCQPRPIRADSTSSR